MVDRIRIVNGTNVICWQQTIDRAEKGAFCTSKRGRLRLDRDLSMYRPAWWAGQYSVETGVTVACVGFVLKRQDCAD